MRDYKIIDGKLYKEVGWISAEGYYKFTLDNKTHYAHRYFYELEHGPTDRGLDIDHIDGDKLNNSLENLRLVPRKVNAFNRHGPNNNSKTGVKNVHWHKATQKYLATVKGKYLGVYSTIEEASEAVDKFREVS